MRKVGERVGGGRRCRPVCRRRSVGSGSQVDGGLVCSITGIKVNVNYFISVSQTGCSTHSDHCSSAHTFINEHMYT